MLYRTHQTQKSKSKLKLYQVVDKSVEKEVSVTNNNFTAIRNLKRLICERRQSSSNVYEHDVSMMDKGISIAITVLYLIAIDISRMENSLNTLWR